MYGAVYGGTVVAGMVCDGWCKAASMLHGHWEKNKIKNILEMSWSVLLKSRLVVVN